MLRRFSTVLASLCLMFGLAAIGPSPSIAISQDAVADAVVQSDDSTVPVPALEPPSENAATTKSPDTSKADANRKELEVEKAKEAAAEEKLGETKDGDVTPTKPDNGAKTDDKDNDNPDKKQPNKKGKRKSEKDVNPQATKPEAVKPEVIKPEATKPERVEPKRLPKLGVSNGPMLPGQPWRVHDMRRPRPAVITPGELSTYDKPGTPPSDAIVLFDGTSLKDWCHVSKEDPSQLLEAQWQVRDGYFEVTSGSGNLQTIDSFGSCQLHIEWQAPAKVRGDSQGRGNSGVFFMDAFEVQVLDSYNNRTYADGQAGALYGQYSPLVNASRKPGEWQIYEIIFEAPKFSLAGELEEPASVTVMHNGIILHHAKKYYGPTGGGVVPKYNPLSPAGPIRIQDHGNPVRFRNVWLRHLN